jgi:cytochrome c553
MTVPRLLFALMLALASLAATAQEKKAGAPADPAEAPVSHCIGCHSIPGYQASFPEVYRVPKIGGQSEQYLVAALRAYRQGDRNHPTMAAIARGLTDEQIAAVAAYYAQRGR